MQRVIARLLIANRPDKVPEAIDARLVEQDRRPWTVFCRYLFRKSYWKRHPNVQAAAARAFRHTLLRVLLLWILPTTGALSGMGLGLYSLYLMYEQNGLIDTQNSLIEAQAYVEEQASLTQALVSETGRQRSLLWNEVTAVLDGMTHVLQQPQLAGGSHDTSDYIPHSLMARLIVLTHCAPSYSDLQTAPALPQYIDETWPGEAVDYSPEFARSPRPQNPIRGYLFLALLYMDQPGVARGLSWEVATPTGDLLTQVGDQGGTFANADLRWAMLAGSRLKFTDLRWASLASSNLTGTEWVSVYLEGADLRRANARGAKWYGVDLRRAHLAHFDARTSSPLFDGCRFDRADLTQARLQKATFVRCDFTDVRSMRWCDLREVILEDAKGLASANWTDAIVGVGDPPNPDWLAKTFGGEGGPLSGAVPHWGVVEIEASEPSALWNNGDALWVIRRKDGAGAGG